MSHGSLLRDESIVSTLLESIVVFGSEKITLRTSHGTAWGFSVPDRNLQPGAVVTNPGQEQRSINRP
jgi:hypothetical protein